MKNGRNRTFSICLTDLPKERILKHSNGKLYLNLTSYDFDEPDQYKNDFSVSLPLTEEQQEAKEKGEPVQRIFLGNGKIWENTMQEASEEDINDLPF